MLSEHKTDFSSLFNRVEFTLEGGYDELPTDKRIKNMNKKGDDYSLVALLFQYGRYLTISSSRKGSNASTLQGIGIRICVRLGHRDILLISILK